MTTVLAGAVSHVPRPPTTITIAVTERMRMRPLTAIAAPSTRNGTVFPARCPKPPCSTGANAMPVSPST